MEAKANEIFKQANFQRPEETAGFMAACPSARQTAAKVRCDTSLCRHQPLGAIKCLLYTVILP